MVLGDEEVVETMQANMEFAEELANKIFGTTVDDGRDALLKAVGTLVHVIYVGTEKKRRDEIVAKLPNLLNVYLNTLDAVDDIGAATERPH